MNSTTSIGDTSAAVYGQVFLPMWPGYLIAGAMLITSYGGHRADAESLDPLIALLSLAGWTYWLVCIHRLHSIIADTTLGRHPIKPGKAVWGHFIPWYNVFWVFIWSNAIARFVRSHAASRMLGGWFGIPLALSLLLSALMGIADAPGDLLEAGMYASPFVLLQYTVGHYLTHRVRGAISQKEHKDIDYISDSNISLEQKLDNIISQLENGPK